VEGAEVLVALAGARPEEAAEWSAGPLAPASVAPLGSSADAQAQAVEAVVEQGRRIAARGGDVVVAIDSLDGLPSSAARAALAAARNIVDGGSLTVVATGSRPLGGETTVVAFDARLAAARRFPSVDVHGSGTIRPELLVGEAGAEAIARSRDAASAG
jgi:transcription termination factor Rho